MSNDRQRPKRQRHAMPTTTTTFRSSSISSQHLPFHTPYFVLAAIFCFPPLNPSIPDLHH